MTSKNSSSVSHSFAKRLFWSVFIIFMLFVFCFFIFQYQREKVFSTEKLNLLLSNYNDQLHLLIKDKQNTEEAVAYFIGTIPEKELRITIIDPHGEVLYDSKESDEMENHISRKEIEQALKEKNGYAIRKSRTTGISYFYSAKNYDGYIFRAALPYDSYVINRLRIDTTFIYFIVGMTIIILLTLLRFSRIIGGTITKLKTLSEKIEKNQEIDDDELQFVDNDLGEISKHIVSLYKKVQESKAQLSLERAKINKHFQYSREGFAMFYPDGNEILSNNLFYQCINLISDKQISSTDKVLNIEEFAPLHSFIHSNINNSNRKKKVLRESITINKNSKIFLVECILFIDNTYEISINDISRQEEESKMKRELTQNIAHELKTPVSSLQGYLETILSNKVDEDRKNFFIERCYAQAQRLADLLRDISVLNRMDEAKDMHDLSDISIYSILKEILQDSETIFVAKHILTEINVPESTIVRGNYSILFSIFRNLFDNAITYAGENITINVSCYREDTKYYYFSFYDTGIGVADEHINRLFERFYRVDKGRSRKSGGTGLGLAIVKNGISFHKGQISAKNRPEGGLEFLFTLKKHI
ncbi:MAG: ATP-binding protein [Bacteroidales bacterium]|nr:ATP-binding protein [Bacteroidales bacterium]